jgi:hypothetical protein
MDGSCIIGDGISKADPTYLGTRTMSAKARADLERTKIEGVDRIIEEGVGEYFNYDGKPIHGI